MGTNNKAIKFKPNKTIKVLKVPKTISFRPNTEEFYEKVWSACKARDMIMNDFMNQALEFALDNME